MEPMVTLENIRMTRLSGNVRYAAAVVRALVKLRAWQMRVRWAGGGYDGPTYLLSICNGRRTGGIFPMAPHARLDDGLFDVVLAPQVSKLTVLVVLFQLLRGRHIYHPRVTYERSPHITIESAPGTPVHADGELIAESAERVDYELLPGKITLLSP
jgi:diacylglycerol kinase (ATP)